MIHTQNNLFVVAWAMATKIQRTTCEPFDPYAV
jgi:hypothetical protein